MSNIQLYFGLTVGLIVMALGAGALLLGPAGWSLLMVGVAISLLTLWSWHATGSEADNSMEQQSGLMPAAIHSNAHPGK